MRRAHRVIPIALALVAGTPDLRAQGGWSDAVDRYIAREMAREHIPGLALGVYRNGRIIKAKGYGLANVELHVPVTPATIFQSGSVGKQFTATAIMMLVEDGRIRLDDSIPKFFPNAPPAWRTITVRHLLSHTSGLSDYTSDEHTKPGGAISYRADYSEDSLVRIIETFPPNFAPGASWEYCNSNYVLLGAIIRKVTGAFYGDVLHERIFGPLGMTSTRVISEEDIVPNRAAGYRLQGGALKNQEWVSPMLNTTADGALYFNVLDLARWDGALSGDRLVTRASLDTMWTVAKLADGTPNSADYGFAWFVDDINGHRAIEHSGGWQGFTTYIARYVEDSFTVVVLTNLDEDHAWPGQIAHAVARLYRPAIAYKAIADTAPEVTALVKAYFEDRAHIAPDSTLVTAEYLAKLRPSWGDEQEVYRARGPVRSVVLVRRTVRRGSPVYRYLIGYDDGPRLAVVQVGPDGRLASVGDAAY